MVAHDCYDATASTTFLARFGPRTSERGNAVVGGASRVGKILVLGGSGMLGHKLFQLLGHRYADTWCTLRSRHDDLQWRTVPLFQTPRVLDGVDASHLDSLDRLLRDV